MTAPDPAFFMARALQLAARGRTSTFPNPRVGCVVARDDQIVGEGWHERAGEPHAEIYALRAAGERARGADLYVTLEPCSHHGRTPPCSDAVIAAGISRVWAAMQDPNPLVAGQGLARLREAGIVAETGLLEKEACKLNRGFVSRMSRGRPFVTLKIGMSLDGRTAMASGESQWISSPESRADVHRLRAEAGAVLTTSSTVLADDPQLTVRNLVPSPPGRGCPEGAAMFSPPSTGSEGLAGTNPDSIGEALTPSPSPGGRGEPIRQPDRIVLDSQARVPAKAKVWNDGARRLWLTAQKPFEAPPGVEHLVIASGVDGRLNLAAALNALGKAGINDVLVECGPILAGALLQAGLVDELLTYLAPSLLGHHARPMARLPGLDRLDQRTVLRYTDVRSVGPDLRITAVPQEH